MQAAYIADGQLSLVERSLPRIQPGWALLKVRLAGICNTDLELLRGYYGFSGIPGHEFVAEVVEAPEAPALVGRRVVADINFACRSCPVCAAGREHHCPHRTVLGIVRQDGALAEYTVAPVANLLPVPDTLPDESAVFTELLAAALQPAQQLHLTARTRLAVVGDGKLGLLMALGLRTWCPDLLLVGRHADKLAIAEAAGLRTARLEPGQEPAALVADLGQFDVVAEAGGRPETAQQALALVRPQGTLVLKTTSHRTSELNLAAVVVNEITLLGSRCGNMALALEQLTRGLVDVRPLIETVFPFADCPVAFARAATPGARKVLVSFGLA